MNGEKRAEVVFCVMGRVGNGDLRYCFSAWGEVQSVEVYAEELIMEVCFPSFHGPGD